MADDVDNPEFWAEVRDRYVPVRELGRGAMGRVVLAQERGLERLVALKLLDARRVALEDRERFRREARILASLRHGNIVAIYALDEAAGTPYMALEYVQGESLAEWVVREGRLASGTVARLLAALADALSVVHRAGVIHRDLKPDNILVDRAGTRPVIVDFGVATVTTSDHSRSEIQKAQGTPAYMAPEQITAEQTVSGRCDLYALGVVGYELLAGRLPFEGSAEAMAAQHVSQPPPPLAAVVPDVTPALARIVHRCLAKTQVDRWADATALREALEQLDQATVRLEPDRDLGPVDLLLLRIVSAGPMHGFQAIQRLREIADQAFVFDEGELYAALHRMHAAGLVHVEWGEVPGGRRTRFYRDTGRGARRLARDGERYLAQAEAIVRLMSPDDAAVP